jgi:hypothetical protein
MCGAFRSRAGKTRYNKLREFGNNSWEMSGNNSPTWTGKPPHRTKAGRMAFLYPLWAKGCQAHSDLHNGNGLS